jgi:hypothetical protein
MLNKNDFKSIWETAYRWENVAPPDDDPTDINEDVVDKFFKIYWAFRQEKIPLFHPSGIKVSHINESLFDVLFWDRTQIRHKSYMKKSCFPKAFFDSLFIQRSDFLDWCEKDRIAPPEFWNNGAKTNLQASNPENKPLIGRHIQEEADKIRCQAIALTLWGLDPSIHPAHMAKSKAMRRYGNGDHYKGKDSEYETVKKWIKECDPQGKNRKTGKPTGENKYLIELETHRLKQD